MLGSHGSGASAMKQCVLTISICICLIYTGFLLILRNFLAVLLRTLCPGFLEILLDTMKTSLSSAINSLSLSSFKALDRHSHQK